MRQLKLIICTGIILLSTSTVAFAAGGEITKELLLNFLYRCITLAGFIGIIVYFAGRKITAFFKDRTERITTGLATLEKNKVTAQGNLQAVEQRIANLETERKAILADYKAQGEAVKASIIAQAEKTAVQITEQAKKTAKSEVDSAIAGIRAELADKVVEAAEKALVKKLSAEEHTKLIDQCLTKVVLN